MAVVDASLCAALFQSEEEAHPASVAWFRDARNRKERIAAPMIVLAEVAAALGRSTRDLEPAYQAIEFLRTSRAVELVLVTEARAAQAARIAATHQIRGCEAIYVALAEELRTTLVTLDRHQRERGAAVVATKAP